MSEIKNVGYTLTAKYNQLISLSFKGLTFKLDYRVSIEKNLCLRWSRGTSRSKNTHMTTRMTANVGL